MAKAYNVPVIDLYRLTEKHLESAGMKRPGNFDKNRMEGICYVGVWK